MYSEDGPPRKKIAVGVAGPVGAAFTVYERNWKCPKCKTENLAIHNTCSQCSAEKPKDSSTVAGKETPWREAFDPKTLHIYYYNSQTGQVQWQRPAEMGDVASGTGWFGRGAANNPLSGTYEQKNLEYLKRPARVQQNKLESKGNQRKEGCNEYNIWYGRWIGDNWNEFEPDEPAETRCHADTDCGYTRADKYHSKKDKRYFCLHFARGACMYGKDCEFFHRIPTLEDDNMLDVMHDCFGRQRHKDHREDMTGVGAYDDPCRTLYVGGLKRVPGYDIDKALWEQFGEWGELESINVIQRLMVAFVRYRLRCNAEFAKVAMTCQDLGGGEILNIRWSYTDPNPVARKAVQRSDQDAVIAGLQAHQICLQETGFNYPLNYNVPKQIPLVNGDDSTLFPNTNQQYLEAAKQGYGVTGDVQSLSEQNQEVAENGQYSEEAYLNATKELEMEVYHKVQDEFAKKKNEYEEKVKEIKSLVNYDEDEKKEDKEKKSGDNKNNEDVDNK